MRPYPTVEQNISQFTKDVKNKLLQSEPDFCTPTYRCQEESVSGRDFKQGNAKLCIRFAKLFRNRLVCVMG